MSLHETTILLKRAGIGSVIGIIGIIIVVILFRVGVSIMNTINPPKIDPPTRVYGMLPPLSFPENAVNGNFTYTLQTTTGDLPDDLPDRLSIFPIEQSTPNFLNLDKVKQKVTAIGMTDVNGNLVPELQLENPYYEWDEQKDYYRKIIFNINSFDFKMTSNYLQSLTVLSGQYISDEIAAIKTVTDFLTTTQLLPADLDLGKTNTKNNQLNYVTYPELYSVKPSSEGNVLEKTTSLSRAHVIRVDLYQKNIEYDLKTGEGKDFRPTREMKLPIFYPNPPYSTMSFWVASGPRDVMVTQAYFTHYSIDTKDSSATYKIKSVEDAYNELQEGTAYIASYRGNDNDILIRDVHLGYYLGEDPMQYLMPIYVFEGNNGFFAYVSATSPEQISQ